MRKPLDNLSKLTPSFSFSNSIFMSDVAVKSGIFGPKFVLLQILNYYPMIKYYNRIKSDLSTWKHHKLSFLKERLIFVCGFNFPSILQSLSCIVEKNIPNDWFSIVLPLKCSTKYFDIFAQMGVFCISL